MADLSERPSNTALIDTTDDVLAEHENAAESAEDGDDAAVRWLARKVCQAWSSDLDWEVAKTAVEAVLDGDAAAERVREVVENMIDTEDAVVLDREDDRLIATAEWDSPPGGDKKLYTEITRQPKGRRQGLHGYQSLKIPAGETGDYRELLDRLAEKSDHIQSGDQDG